MAKNELNKTNDVKVTSENEQAVPVAEAPAPKMIAEEIVILAHEGEAALREMGEAEIEPPTPFDIPTPGDVVVPFDEIREAAREAEQTATPEKQETEKSDKAPKKTGAAR